MKNRILTAITLAALPLLLWSAVPFLDGCSSVNRTAYQGVATARVTAGLAVNEWNVYVSQKHPPRTQQLAVRSAFDKWRAGMLVLCDAGAAYSAAVATNAPVTLSGQLSASLEQAMTDSAQDQADLVGLITAFGVKLPTSATPSVAPTAPPTPEFTPLLLK